ncbi:MAG: DUF1592 domain-containing protein [Nannocystaceae bacterium]
MNEATVSVASRWGQVGVLVLGTGCYSGVPDGMAEQDPQTEDDDGGDEPIGGSEALQCDEAARNVGEPVVRRLTRREYNAVVADLVGDLSAPADGFLPESIAESGFSNYADALRVGAVEAFDFQSAAEAMAVSTSEERFDTVFPCDVAQTQEAGCIDQFVAEFGRRAFRRPLSDDELNRYSDLYLTGIDTYGERGGVRVVLAAMLQSPLFLYRAELGAGTPDEQGRLRLSPFEVASALSFSLLGTTPDDELLDLAASGALDTDEEVEEHARALLEDPRARFGAVDFYRQMFGFDELLDASKDEQLFPHYEAQRGSMLAELDAFVGHALFEGDRSLRTLLTAEYGFLDHNLAQLYGVEYSGTPFGRTELAGSGRAGILTMPGVMANFAATQQPSIAQRGVFVRSRLLCQPIPDPPPGAFDGLPPEGDSQTLREYLEQVTEPATCQACHSMINGPGFAFDGFDAIGAAREGFDLSGELNATRDIDGPFDGAVELGERLAGSEQVKECMTIQHFRWALGRDVSRQDACSIVDAYARFDEAGGDLLELAVATVSSEAFLYRRSE